jgi:hypothetical protein
VAGIVDLGVDAIHISSCMLCRRDVRPGRTLRGCGRSRSAAMPTPSALASFTSDVRVRRNAPSRVASGTDIHVTDNTFYGAQRTSSNVGIYVWNQYPTPCSDIEVARNQVQWLSAAGDANGFWNGGNCGTISGYDDTNSNDFNATLDQATLHVTL